METLGLNIVDFIIIFTIVSSGIFALFRGIIIEILSLFLWAFAFFISISLEPSFTSQIVQYLKNNDLASALAYFLIFLGVMVLGTLTIRLLKKLINWSGWSSADKFLGVLFGFLRGFVIIVAIFYLLPSQLLTSDVMTASKISPFFIQVAPAIAEFILDNFVRSIE